MSLAKKNIKKLLNEVKKNKGQPLNIGIEVGGRIPQIDYYCYKCEKAISRYQYKTGKGLCKPCVAIN
jgi:hypothetical protein